MSKSPAQATLPGFAVNLSPIQHLVNEASTLSAEARASLFNQAQRILHGLVRDIAPDPAACPQVVRADRVTANDYNPNAVAPTELDLLERSIAEDGFTQPVVVCSEPERDRHVVVDGFHRWTVLTTRLRRAWITVAPIARPMRDRMAATVRHNRARGKHQVDRMADLVRGMLALDWDNATIAEKLGMSEEELLRLMQMTGAARLMAADSYSREWASIDAEDATEAEGDDHADA